VGPKDVYRELGINYRYFATWRWRVVMGWFLSLSAIAVAYAWAAEKEYCGVERILWGGASLMSLTLWALEGRNRPIYRSCLVEGQKLERDARSKCSGQQEPPEAYGYYTSVRSSVGPFAFTHSSILDGMWACSTMFFFLMCVFGKQCSELADFWTSSQGHWTVTVSAASFGLGMDVSRWRGIIVNKKFRSHSWRSKVLVALCTVLWIVLLAVVLSVVWY
jgi:hypothetical protein